MTATARASGQSGRDAPVPPTAPSALDGAALAAWAAKVRDQGYGVLEAALPPDELVAWLAGVATAGEIAAGRGGRRGLLAASSQLRELAARGLPAQLAAAVLGETPLPRAVRAVLFDKTPGANWKVPWHQDTTIAVTSRRDGAGFGAWSVKDGVPHVQPPAAILERMLAVPAGRFAEPRRAAGPAR